VFPQKNRLRHEQDIKTLFLKGKSVFGNVVGLKFRRNEFFETRFAVIIGTKVSKNAVDRNRIRRKIREVIRVHISEIACGYDVGILVRPEAVKKTKQEIETAVVQVLKRSSLLKEV